MYFSLRRSIALVVFLGLLVSSVGLHAAHYGARVGARAAAVDPEGVKSLAIIALPSEDQKTAIAVGVQPGLDAATRIFDAATYTSYRAKGPDSSKFSFQVKAGNYDDFHISLALFSEKGRASTQVQNDTQGLAKFLINFAAEHGPYSANIYELQLYVNFITSDKDAPTKTLESRRYVMPDSASIGCALDPCYSIDDLSKAKFSRIAYCNLILKVGTYAKLKTEWSAVLGDLDSRVLGRSKAFDGDMQTHITVAQLCKYTKAKADLGDLRISSDFIKNECMNDFSVIVDAFKAASNALRYSVNFSRVDAVRNCMPLPLDTLAISERKNDKTTQVVRTVALSGAGAAIVEVGAAAGFGGAAARPATGYDVPGTPSYADSSEYGAAAGASAAAAGVGYGGAGARPVSTYGAGAAAWPAQTPADDELTELTKLFRAGVLDRDAYDAFCAYARSQASTRAPRYGGAAGYGYGDGGAGAGAGSGKGFDYGAAVVPTSRYEAKELARTQQALAERRLSPLTSKERELVLLGTWNMEDIFRGRKIR